MKSIYLMFTADSIEDDKGEEVKSVQEKEGEVKSVQEKEEVKNVQENEEDAMWNANSSFWKEVNEDDQNQQLETIDENHEAQLPDDLQKMTDQFMRTQVQKEDKIPEGYEDKIITESIENFKGLVITPNNETDLNHQSPEYLNMLFNQNCFIDETITTEEMDSFIKLHLNPLPEQKVKTCVICETENYLYEMIYIYYTLRKEVENIKLNNIGTLLALNGDKIYGNVIVIKTNVPRNTKNMIFTDLTKNDLYDSLKSRAFHTGIMLNDDNELEEFTYHNLKHYNDEYFYDDERCTEIGFLKHNVTIYYIKAKKGGFKLGNLFDFNVSQCIIISKITDQHYTDMSLHDLIKIMKLSEKINKEEWQSKGNLPQEKDNLGRNIILTRFRVLDIVYDELIK